MWFLFACTDPDPELARREWMRQLLIDENQPWIAREPDAVAAKFAKMDADVYDFMRGTTGYWYAQLAVPGERPPTAFLDDPDAASILLVGDPHIENLGTCLAGEEPTLADADPQAPLTIEAVDLDGSGFGPWVMDPRRASMALGHLASSLPGCDEACVDAVAGALAAGFADEVLAQAAGEPPFDAGTEDATDGAYVTDLYARARAAGLEQEALAEWTVIQADGRFLERTGGLDDGYDGVLSLTVEESTQLDRLLTAWESPPEGFRRLDAVRRYGAGVASLPAVRYYVLYDFGDDSRQDDRLLQLREVVDPPTWPGTLAPPLYASNAERIEAVTRTLWSRPDADVRMAGLQDGAMTFKLTTLSGWFQTFDHETIAGPWLQGDASEADLQALATRIGRLLAAAQARGATAEGRPALEVLVAELDGRRDEWVAELSAQVRPDVERLRADAELFASARELYGPLLGAETLSDDLP